MKAWSDWLPGGDHHWVHALAGAVGRAASLGGLSETARHIHSLLADHGHSDSHFQLGRLHEADRNAVQAALSYRQAALLGHHDAQYRLACLYASGQGFMRDPLQARYWYREALRHGHRGADPLPRS